MSEHKELVDELVKHYEGNIELIIERLADILQLNDRYEAMRILNEDWGDLEWIARAQVEDQKTGAAKS